MNLTKTRLCELDHLAMVTAQTRKVRSLARRKARRQTLVWSLAAILKAKKVEKVMKKK